MENKEKFLAGVGMGEDNSPLKPIMEKLSDLGILVPDTTISKIRMGVKNGSEIVQLILCSKFLASNDASLKKKFYLEIINKGLEVRLPQKKYQGRYNSEGHTKQISEELGIRASLIRSVLRAARTELVYGSINEPNVKVSNFFLGTAEFYLNSVTNPCYPNFASKQAKILDDNWDRKSIKNFYSIIYYPNKSRMIGVWMIYELDALKYFYEHQENTLTPFDKVLLETQRRRKTENRNAVIDQIRQDTGISFNEHALSVHVNALCFGTPINPLICTASPT